MTEYFRTLANGSVFARPGDYWMGDPAAAFDGRTWIELSRNHDFSTSPVHGTATTSVLAFPASVGGAGVPGLDDMPIASGLIGLVPASSVTTPQGMNLVGMPEGAVCFRMDESVHLGDFSVQATTAPLQPPRVDTPVADGAGLVARPCPFRVVEEGVLVDAGLYWMGDPCYAFDSPAWDAMEDMDGVFGHGLVSCTAGRFLTAFGTEHGDGTYHTDEGQDISVDSGTIGLVTAREGEPTPDWMFPVRMEQDALCSRNGGVIRLGHVSIDTDPQHEPEREEPDEDEPDEDGEATPPYGRARR